MGAPLQTRKALRAIGLATLFLLVLFALGLVAESYGANRNRAAVSAHRAAHVVAIQYHWLFETTAQTLHRIEQAVTRPSTAASGASLPLDAAAQELPAGFSFAVYDTSGRLTQATPNTSTAANIADQPYFRAARNGTELDLAPITTGTATGAFLMVRRLDRNGSFAGVATVSIPLAALATLSGTLTAEGTSTLALVHTDGMLLARSPPVAPMDLSGWRLFTELGHAPDGTFGSLSPADGINRIVGYWRLADWPVVALAGIDRAQAMAPFWETMLLAALLALPVLLGMGWLTHDLFRLMRIDDARQSALTEAVERSNFLLREIHHRVKNNLQTVSSLIRLERLGSDVKSGLLGRIGAMVAVHEAMYLSDEFEEVNVAPYLERLVQNVGKSHAGSVTLHIDIAPVQLGGDRAMQLGLLVNELVSNAFKHAFRPRKAGTLTVSIHDRGDGQLRLVVADDGPGYDPETCPKQMGSRLIEAFASQLGGSVTVASSGATTVTVDFPLIYGAAPPVQRNAHEKSSAGLKSTASIRASNPARSNKRT